METSKTSFDFKLFPYDILSPFTIKSLFIPIPYVPKISLCNARVFLSRVEKLIISFSFFIPLIIKLCAKVIAEILKLAIGEHAMSRKSKLS